ncbi:hypothetical protein OIV83_000442 [Microbotryomycetes sp. JL201]|nr:hypothetical protein OIV83_000442 [Microbotryomycetes sp. JL201]
MTDSAQPRQVAVALVVSSASLKSTPRFLVVGSRKHTGKFVLPKGGIEDGETAQEAAERESWEEAGLKLGQALHLDHLTTLSDSKPHKSSPAQDPKDSAFVSSTIYNFELFVVQAEDDALAEDWPEKEERTRRWVDGWRELEDACCWGRREDVMREAIRIAQSRLQ